MVLWICGNSCLFWFVVTYEKHLPFPPKEWWKCLARPRRDSKTNLATWSTFWKWVETRTFQHTLVGNYLYTNRCALLLKSETFFKSDLKCSGVLTSCFTIGPMFSILNPSLIFGRINLFNYHTKLCESGKNKSRYNRSLLENPGHIMRMFLRMICLFKMTRKWFLLLAGIIWIILDT